jgi:hypothetical protein
MTLADQMVPTCGTSDDCIQKVGAGAKINVIQYESRLAYTGIGILYPFRYTSIIILVFSETANVGVH